MSTEVQVFEDMLGVTMTSVVLRDDKEELLFTAEDGRRFRFYHSQGCCESVEVEDVTGELSDLVGEPIRQAELVSEVSVDLNYGSSTWSFYKFATGNGAVVVRWLGSSNGYYSETVAYQALAPGEEILS